MPYLFTNQKWMKTIRKCNGLITYLHKIRQQHGQQQDQIHDTNVLDGWAGTVHCYYNAERHKQFNSVTKKRTKRLTNRQ